MVSTYTALNHTNKSHLRLLLLLLLLVLLRFCNRGQPCLVARLWGLIPPGGDRSEVRANNAALVLHGAPRPFFRDFLRDSLFVHPAVNLRPRDLAWVLAL